MCLWQHLTGYLQISGHWLHHLWEVSSYLEWRVYISLKKKHQQWLIQWIVVQISVLRKKTSSFLTMFSWIIDSLVCLDKNITPSGWQKDMDRFFFLKHITALSNKRDIWQFLFETEKLDWINLKRHKKPSVKIVRLLFLYLSKKNFLVEKWTLPVFLYLWLWIIY